MAELKTERAAGRETGRSFIRLAERHGDIESELIAAPFRAESAELLADTLYRRAVEAAIWGMPLANFDALRQAYLGDAGARLHDVIFWSEPPAWTFQAPTPDIATRFVMFFLDISEGPVVVEIPPAGKAALSGTLIDSWNVPIVDVGAAGADHGRGAKYLVLPSTHEARSPLGLLPVRSPTSNVYGLLRLNPRSQSDDDLEEAIDRLRQLRIYPLTGSGAGRRTRFIDMTHRRFEGTVPWDAGFFASLAQMVAEEPARSTDQSMLALLETIGIAKDAAFQPDAAAEKVLSRAIAQAHAFIADGRRRTGSAPWPDRRWRSPASHVTAFTNGDRVKTDERAFVFFGSFGLGRQAHSVLHLEAFFDSAGEALDGSGSYRLRIPADMPCAKWSVAAYDAETAAFVREAPVVGRRSDDPDLVRNDDGSCNLVFSARRPREPRINWISTAAGQRFFVVLRGDSQAPATAAPDWQLGDIEPIS